MKSKYESLKSLIDMFLLLAFSYAMLYFLSLCLISEQTKKKNNIEAKAEFMITMYWENDDDVDMYLEDPNGAIIYFSRREDGVMHLDRDDRGHQTDTIILPSGRKLEIKLNQEIATLRGIVPGEFVSNIHMFAKRDPEPCKVIVKIEKINPYFLVWFKEYELVKNGERKTVLRFHLNSQGEVTETNELDKNLLESTGHHSYGQYGS